MTRLAPSYRLRDEGVPMTSNALRVLKDLVPPITSVCVNSFSQIILDTGDPEDSIYYSFDSGPQVLWTGTPITIPPLVLIFTVYAVDVVGNQELPKSFVIEAFGVDFWLDTAQLSGSVKIFEFDFGTQIRTDVLSTPLNDLKSFHRQRAEISPAPPNGSYWIELDMPDGKKTLPFEYEFNLSPVSGFFPVCVTPVYDFNPLDPTTIIISLVPLVAPLPLYESFENWLVNPVVYTGYSPIWVSEAETSFGSNRFHVHGGSLGCVIGPNLYRLKGWTGSLPNVFRNGDIYNRTTGMTTFTPDMSPQARAIQLPIIQVIVAGQERFYCFGGEYPGNGAQDDGEYYEPDSNTWTTVTPMTLGGRTRYVATVDHVNSDIIIGAGFTPFLVSTSLMERYDCVANTWHTTNHLTGNPLPAFPVSGEVGEFYAMALWANKLHVLHLQSSFQIWTYDLIAEGSWTLEAETFPGEQTGANYFQEGPFVYFFGGHDGAADTNDSRRYDCRDRTFAVLPALAENARRGYVGKDNGVTFMIGRGNFPNTALGDKEISVGV